MARDQQGNLHPMSSCLFFKGNRAFLLAQLNFLHAGNLFFIGTHTSPSFLSWNFCSITPGKCPSLLAPFSAICEPKKNNPNDER